MTKTNDGGPAFPGQAGFRDAYGSTTYSMNGMSLRDYFAAHAPSQPQDWFEPTMDCELRDLNTTEEQKAWSVRYVKARYSQWPYAWADAMLAEREKGG